MKCARDGCNNEFKLSAGGNRTKKYCCPKCGRQARSRSEKLRVNGEQVKCAFIECNNVFDPTLEHGHRKYCSPKCRSLHGHMKYTTRLVPFKKTCARDGCDNEFAIKMVRQKYCCQKCNQIDLWKKWRTENPGKRREHRKRYTTNNRDRVRELARESYKRHAHKRISSAKRWISENREKYNFASRLRQRIRSMNRHQLYVWAQIRNLKIAIGENTNAEN